MLNSICATLLLINDFFTLYIFYYKAEELILGIYLSIYGIYITPLEGNYSEAVPGPSKKEGLKETIKRARKITWKRAQFESNAIPDRRTSRREGPILLIGCVRTWYQIVTTRGRAK